MTATSTSPADASAVRVADVAVDTGGTGIDVVFIIDGAEVYRHPTIKVSGDSDRNLEGDFDVDMSNLITAIIDGRNLLKVKIRSIGMGVAGNFDETMSTLIGAGNLTWWVGKPIRGRLADAFPGATIVLGHDGAAGALAEALFNPEMYGVNLGFVVWGTGIGFAFVEWEDGKPKAKAGEAGHVNVNPGGGRNCKCGQRDCWEAYCGGAGMCTTYEVDFSGLLTDHQWDEVIDRMVVGLRALQCTLQLSTYVFGGSVAVKENLKRQILDAIHSGLKSDLKVVRPPKLLTVSIFGERAGTWGAYALLVSAGITDALPVF